MEIYKKKLTNIKTFVFDIDGVVASIKVVVAPDTEPYRVMNVRDGFAMQLAVKKGFNIAIISGAKSEALLQRFTYLGINDVFLGVHNKLDKFHQYIKEKNIDKDTVLYMGDDLPDYQIMQEVGLPTCPANACHEIKSAAQYISDIEGGEGCVRDVIEQVLKAQELWFDIDALTW